MQWAVIIIVLVGLVVGYVLYPQDAVAPQTETETTDTEKKSANLRDLVDDVETIRTQVEIYDDISVSAGTRTLDLSGRGLSGSLKAEIRKVSALEELNISDNNFTGLPAEVGQLSGLRILNLSNNPFTGLPYELGNLQNLQTLDLRGTNYAPQDLEVIRETLPSTTNILIDQ